MATARPGCNEPTTTTAAAAAATITVKDEGRHLGFSATQASPGSIAHTQMPVWYLPAWACSCPEQPPVPTACHVCTDELGSYVAVAFLGATTWYSATTATPCAYEGERTEMGSMAMAGPLPNLVETYSLARGRAQGSVGDPWFTGSLTGRRGRHEEHEVWECAARGRTP